MTFPAQHPTSGAVFLSYAREDTDATRRIADALRAAGVEVWFDQSELRGGDAWDANIRRQIRECALFVPIISAHTQARPEGYFRLEWKLADRRTDLIGKSKAFLVPVCIDDTRESDADVPDSFLAAQWVRLHGGNANDAFCARVKTLLEGELGSRPPPAASISERPSLLRQAYEGQGAAAVPGKNVRRRWLVPGLFGAAIIVALALWQPWRKADAPAAPVAAKPPLDFASAKSIAVLPFENLSAESDSAGFTDGMHDEVLTAVAKVASLKVIGRTSVLPYRDPAQRNLRKIATELGVTTVVEGTVRRSGNRVRIGVKLVDAQTSRQLWGETYERELTDVFAIQAAVAQEIAATLKAAFTASERALIERRPTENARAYELYLQAKLLTNDLSNSASRKDWDRAVGVLDEAVAADPTFAQAHALLARTHANIYWFGSLDPSPARRELTRQSLAAAQRLAPMAPETRFAEGRFAYACNLEFAEAMRHYVAALAEMPNDSGLLHQLGLTHRQLGRHAETVAALTRAHELNPLNLELANNLLGEFNLLRRFSSAVTIGDRYTSRSPESALIFRNTAIARYELDGDRARLVASLRTRPAEGNDPHGLTPPYEAALYAGDLTDAARRLADPRFATLLSVAVALVEPVALHRALVARLLNQRDEPTIHANEATDFFRSRVWTRRQQPVVALSLVRAAAYAGRDAEALRLAAELRRDLGGRNGVDEVSILNELGRVYALLGARDEALDCLRTLMTGPNSPFFGTPRIIRIDPCWSRIADDPRFDEMLKSAKPL